MNCTGSNDRVIEGFVEQKEYLEYFHRAIRHLHKCEPTHLESVSLKETFRGETVWEGMVEVFLIADHPRAKKCYAWSDEKNSPGKIIAILEIPPVRCPLDAVKAYIVAANKHFSD